MSPWWKRHAGHRQICERCRGIEDVHRGLCRHCRAQLLVEESPGGESVQVRPVSAPMPDAADIEPTHDRPWVHRGGG